MYEIYRLLDLALVIYSYALLIYILMSWFPGARESSFGSFLGRISEPYLEQFRKFIPPIGMIDISQIVEILVLFLARNGLLALFSMIGW